MSNRPPAATPNNIVNHPSQDVQIKAMPVVAGTAPCQGQLTAILDSGELMVSAPDGHEYCCDWLESSANVDIELTVGDTLLFMPGDGDAKGCVLGRIGRYKKPSTPETLKLEASQAVMLKCGESSVELRQDGKLLIKGEDILMRAQQTQRIKGGTVAIN